MNNNGFLKPERIIGQLEIRDNMIIADFGSGSGHFSIPFAKLANQGKVYAIDVMKDTLEAVVSRAKLEGIKNIETVHANLEILGSSKLEDNAIDLVLMRNILFQSQQKEDIMKEAYRVLKPDGMLLIIEWIPGSSLAPKGGWMIKKEAAQKLAEESGFSLDRELEMDGQQYGLVLNKN